MEKKRNNAVMKAENSGFGFLPAVNVFGPMPHQESGFSFSRTMGDREVRYDSPQGVPYGSPGRLCLLSICTAVVQNHTRVIELGSVDSFLTRVGLDIHLGGGKGSAKIDSYSNQIKRLAWTTVSARRLSRRTGRVLELIQRFMIAEKMTVAWGIGDGEERADLLVDGDSSIMVSREFFEYVQGHAVPVDLGCYMSLKTARDRDMYVWLVRRLHRLRSEQVVPWDSLLAQFFGDIDSKHRTTRAKRFEKRLVSIRDFTYPEARIEAVETGLKLKPSPPHITARSEVGEGFGV